ncbi:MAG: molybdopterin-dependent oxidoreductase [Dehalococcoidales bacterium]|nr:molybdopterin-dependent oxidoreductase [Dehalococcoidales bacterium]MDP6738131.1 molybdopterin-dependent oxidoreductase [Dehalococcoidales bacterium]
MAETYKETFGAKDYPYKVLGQRKPNITAVDRVTGKAMFDIDYYLKGMLFSRSFHCPHPSAKILSMDTSKAEAVPGVRLVLTPFNYPDCFYEPRSYFAGHEIAAVVADTQDIADHAVMLIEVEYEKLPHVLNMYDAMKPGAPVVWPDAEQNLETSEAGFFSEKTADGLYAKRVNSPVQGFGDVEQGFKECDHIIEVDDIRHAMQHIPVSKGRGIMVDYNSSEPSKTVTFYTGSKGLYADRARNASVLGVPLGKSHLVSPYASSFWGPGHIFGGPSFERANRIANFASRDLGKPVYHHYNYHEEMLISNYWQSLTRVKLGFKEGGILHAMDMTHTVESGKNTYTAERNSVRAGGMLAYNRNIQHMKLVTRHASAHRLIIFSYVGYGTMDGVFAVELAFDQAAEAMNMDPIKLRQLNCMKKGGFDCAWSRPLAYCSAEGHSECWDVVAAKTNWATKWGGWNAHNTKTGVVRSGIGTGQKTHTGGGWNGSAMLCKMFPDGTFELTSSMGDSGQGEPTGNLMMAAEVLGIPYERGSMIRGSTGFPYSIYLGGSTGTWNLGYSTWEAAQNVRKQVLVLGAQLFDNATFEDVDMDADGVFLKSDPTDKKTYVQCFAKLQTAPAFENRGGSYEVAGYAYRRALKGLCVPREKGAAIWEIDVDTETGGLSNLRCTTSDNVGFAMNPAALENQQSQGANHGGPWSLWGGVVTDPSSGKVLSYNWIYDYPSTHMDITTTTNLIELAGDESHPFGATPASEGQPNPHAGAISNAIYNAIGKRVIHTPFTPANILKALGKV